MIMRLDDGRKARKNSPVYTGFPLNSGRGFGYKDVIKEGHACMP
jgi:hypothetical protein